jgi:hypothetical protein
MYDAKIYTPLFFVPRTMHTGFYEISDANIKTSKNNTRSARIMGVGKTSIDDLQQ